MIGTSDIGRRTSDRGNSFGRWLVDKGWVHVVLLAGAALFLFPFLWMAGTSMKTDEEVVENALFPTIPAFRAASPYVRKAPDIERPVDVDARRWRGLVPALLAECRTAVAAAPHPRAGVDDVALDESAAARLCDRLVSRLPKTTWRGEPASAVAALRALITPEGAAAALDERLARIDLVSLQLKTLDARIFTIAAGADIAARWTVEAGDARLVPTGGTTRLDYRFSSGAAEPLVLRCDFAVPAGVAPDGLHQLAVSLKADDSWHRIDATLDWGGRRWASQRTTYLAQHRVMGVVFQPPTFDDQTFKARTWIPLAATDAAPAGADPLQASLRLIVSPSSTARAIWGKATRNYQRAVMIVPFWTYTVNSLILVALVVAGSLFSSAFVGYAFARLNWPGRGVAVVIMLATMMLPSQVTMIPTFLVWRELGWYNTLNPLWVPAWFGNAFFIFLMVQQMKTIPRELEEAARIDGFSRLQTWWYIIVPQVKPTLAGIAIMSFMGAWNEFMGPLIYLRDQAKFPLSLGLFGMRIQDNGNVDWTVIMAGNLLMTLPVVLIFFFFQRYFIQGMTVTGMKG